MKEKYSHIIELGVRDYECDLQGIVNNAVYQNYLEHARHEMLRSLGIDFVELHKSGIDPVLIKSEIDYNFSLKSPEKFFVGTNIVLDGGVRIIFFQDIYRIPDYVHVLGAKMTTLCLKNGKPVRIPAELKKIL
jgi:acyl-CoA thioester hydrolase